MSDNDTDHAEIAKWDPGFTERVYGFFRPIAKLYFRSEVHGLDNIPSGGVLVVGNHSGGAMPMDVPIFAADFYEKFGYDRPVLTLSMDILFTGVTGNFFRRIGYIGASRDNAAAALRTDGVVVVFPGGDYDVYRPTVWENKIDFGGRKGYVSTAIEAGVPIVPMVSIGGQQTQLYLSRGTGLAKALRLDKLMRVKILPISFGFPFGFSTAIPPNIPLPTKIVTEILEPINIAERFGDDPDIDEVDAHVRSVMQVALDRLGRKRRLPILG